MKAVWLFLSRSNDNKKCDRGKISENTKKACITRRQIKSSVERKDRYGEMSYDGWKDYIIIGNVRYHFQRKDNNDADQITCGDESVPGDSGI